MVSMGECKAHASGKANKTAPGWFEIARKSLRGSDKSAMLTELTGCKPNGTPRKHISTNAEKVLPH